MEYPLLSSTVCMKDVRMDISLFFFQKGNIFFPRVSSRTSAIAR